MSRPCLRLLQEGVKTENDHINLKVAGQDGSVVQFKIKRHTPLSKLMKAYCERQVRCGRGRLRVRARGCAPVNVCTFACTRVHGCVHTCVSAHARASLCGPSLLPSSPGCAHRLSQQTHCPPFPRTWGAVASGLGSGWTPPPLEVAEAEPVCSSSSSPQWLGHVCGDAALVTVWFPDSARSRPSVPQSSLAAHTVTSQTASF